jgi:hypothetical protein
MEITPNKTSLAAQIPHRNNSSMNQIIIMIHKLGIKEATVGIRMDILNIMDKSA